VNPILIKVFINIVFKLIKTSFTNKESIRKFFNPLPNILLIFTAIIVGCYISKYARSNYYIEKFKGKKA